MDWEPDYRDRDLEPQSVPCMAFRKYCLSEKCHGASHCLVVFKAGIITLTTNIIMHHILIIVEFIFMMLYCSQIKRRRRPEGDHYRASTGFG